MTEDYLRRIDLLESRAVKDHDRIQILEEKMESLQNPNKNHLGLTTDNQAKFEYGAGDLHHAMKIPTDRTIILVGYLDEKERYPIKKLEEIYSASALSVREKMYMAFFVWNLFYTGRSRVEIF